MSGARNPYDTLPEETQYVDTGCSLAPSCLNCPLRRCQYDEPGGLRAIRRRERDAGIVVLLEAGVTAREAAAISGFSLRTVQRARERALGEARAGGGAA